MNVIFDNEDFDAFDAIDDSQTLLELDTIMFKDIEEPVTAYAVIGPTDINVMVLPKLASMISLHKSMIRNYKTQQWDFVEDAIDELKGTWPALVDEFYIEIISRVRVFRKEPPTKDWAGVYIA